MSIHVIALPHPFNTIDSIEKDAPCQSVRELYAGLETGFGPDQCYCEINGQRIHDLDYIPPDGTTVYLKTVPAGGGDPKNTGAGMKVVGSLLVAAGIIVSIASGGLLSPVGAMLIGAGVGMFAGGMALYNMQIPGLPENPVARPGIRGSKNRPRPYGSVPVLFGRHLVTPDFAAAPYVSIDNNEMYLTQLFCAGYADMEIETDTLKIGDTKLTELSATKNIGTILSGNDSVLRVEILSGSSNPGTVYPRRVTPIDVGRQVKEKFDDGSDGSVIVTTPADTTMIDINLSFPQGLFSLDDKGKKQNATVTVNLLIKPAGAADSAYTLFGFVRPQTGSPNVTDNTKSALYFAVKKTVAAGSYTIKVGTVGTATDKEYKAFYVTTVNAYRDGPPVEVGIQQKLLLVALRVKATDRLNNVIDNFNFIAQARAPVYSGSGSGLSAWRVGLTRNPASALLYALRGPVNRRPVEDRHIDWPAFEALFTWCENHHYYCDAVLADKLTLMSLLTNIAATCRATPSKRDGLFSVIHDIERGAERQYFTPANSIDYTQDIAFADIPPALELQFIAAADDQGRDIWKDDILKVYDTPNGLQGSLDPANFQNVPLWGVTNARQAFLLGMYNYACLRLRPRRHTIIADYEYLMCTRGSRIKYSGDTALSGIAWGRIAGLLVDGARVTGFTLGEHVEMRSGGRYRIRVRTARNELRLYDVITETAYQNFVTLNGAIPLADSPQAGDLFALGEIGSMELDLIVANIEPLNDQTARLICVDYAPAIFGVDDPGFVIPPWRPGVSIGGAVDSGVPSDPPPAYLDDVYDRLSEAQKEASIKQYTDYRYAKSNSPDQPPPFTADADSPGANWFDAPPASGEGEYVWLTAAPWRTGQRLGAWSSPMLLSGRTGQNAVYLDLDNENHSIACDSEGNPVAGSLGFTVQATVYDGTMVVNPSEVSFIIVPDNLNISISNNGVISVPSNAILQNTTLITVIALYKGMSLYCTLTLVKVYAGSAGLDGEDAVVYSIQPSVSVVRKSNAGVLDPASVSCDQYVHIGNQTSLSHERLEYRLSTMASPALYTGPVNIGSAVWVDFILYHGSGMILDSERVPVVQDGQDALGIDSIPRNPWGYWPLDKIDDGITPDLSGNGRHASVSGMTPTRGKFGNGLLTLGGYANAGNILGGHTRDFTVSVWTDKATSVLGKRGSGYSSTGFGIRGGKGYFISNNPNTERYAGQFIADGNLHHLVLMVKNKVMYFYVDRQLNGQVNISDIYNSPLGNDSFLIGAVYSSELAASGTTIDEVAVFDRALTDSEIEALYYGWMQSISRDGNGISTIMRKYRLTSTNVMPAQGWADPGWLNDMPTPTSEDRYLWQIERIQFTGAPEKITVSPLTIYGQTGTAGRGISSISYKWKVTSNDTKPIQAWTDAGWLTTMPVTTDTNRWLWYIERTTFSDNTTSDVIGLQAVHGQTGTAGRGISSIEYKYRRTNSVTAPTQLWGDNGWVQGMPALDETYRWLWFIERITYTDNTIKDTIGLQAVHGETGDDGVMRFLQISCSALNMANGSHDDRGVYIPAFIAAAQKKIEGDSVSAQSAYWTVQETEDGTSWYDLVNDATARTSLDIEPGRVSSMQAGKSIRGWAAMEGSFFFDPDVNYFVRKFTESSPNMNLYSNWFDIGDDEIWTFEFTWDCKVIRQATGIYTGVSREANNYCQLSAYNVATGNWNAWGANSNNVYHSENFKAVGTLKCISYICGRNVPVEKLPRPATQINGVQVNVNAIRMSPDYPASRFRVRTGTNPMTAGTVFDFRLRKPLLYKKNPPAAIRVRTYSDSAKTQLIADTVIPVAFDGEIKFTEARFCRSNAKPATPNGELPANWHINPPNEPVHLWQSTVSKDGYGRQLGDWSEPVRITGEDGKDLVFLDLSNEFISLAADFTGTLLSHTAITSQATLYKGASALASGVTWSISPAVSGVSIDPASGLITVAAGYTQSVDRQEVSITAAYNGNNYHAVLTIARIKGGAGFNYLGEWAAGTAYKPNDVVTSEGASFICVQDTTPYGLEFPPKNPELTTDKGEWASTNNSSTYKTGDVFTYNGKRYITIRNGSTTTNPASVVSRAFGSSNRYFDFFAFEVFTPSPAIIFELFPSVSAVSRNAAGTPDPGGVSCTVLKITGSDAPVADTTKTIKYITNLNGSETAIGHGVSITIPSAQTGGLTFIEFRLYDGSTIIDKERVPIVQDGQKGDDGLGIDSLPRDAYAHYSCDDLEMPDGEAHFRQGYFTAFPAGWSSNGNKSIAYPNGKIKIEGNYGHGIYMPNPASQTVFICKLTVISGSVRSAWESYETKRCGVGEHLIVVGKPAATSSAAIIYAWTDNTVFEISYIYIGNAAYLPTLPLLDNSGNGRHASVNGMVPTRGIFGNGLLTAGGYASTGNILNGHSGDFAVSVWANKPTHILGKRGGGHSMGFGIYNGIAYFISDNPNAELYAGTAFVENGSLHHLVIMVKNKVLSLHVDGQLSGSTNITNYYTKPLDNYNFIIGGLIPGTLASAGTIIDEIAVFDRALTDDEIAALFKTTLEKNYTNADWQVDQNNPNNVRTPCYLGAAYTPVNSDVIVITVSANFTKTVKAYPGDWVAYLGTNTPAGFPLWVNGMCMRWNGFSWEQIPINASGLFESKPYMDAIMDLAEGAPSATFISVVVRDLIAAQASIDELTARTAFIEKLFSKIITMSDDGVIKSEGFTGINGATPGFRLKAYDQATGGGLMEVFKGKFKNIEVLGNSVFRGLLSVTEIDVNAPVTAVTSGNGYLIRADNIETSVSNALEPNYSGTDSIYKEIVTPASGTATIKLFFKLPSVSVQGGGASASGTYTVKVNNNNLFNPANVVAGATTVNINLPSGGANVIKLFVHNNSTAISIINTTFELLCQNDPKSLRYFG